MQHQEAKKSSSRPILVALAILATGAGGAIFGAAFTKVATPISLFPPASRTTLTLAPTPSVVVALKELRRLETMQMHVEKVVDLKSDQQHLFGLVHAKDAILLVASGDVTAGVDLGELSDADVHADFATRTATVTLPAARIFATRVDNEHTYVHSRSTDLLARRDELLETDARREAERAIEAAAASAGIADKAAAGAVKSVESLLRSLGFEQITVRVRSS
jgi:hypothetical protein